MMIAYVMNSMVKQLAQVTAQTGGGAMGISQLFVTVPNQVVSYFVSLVFFVGPFVFYFLKYNDDKKKLGLFIIPLLVFVVMSYLLVNVIASGLVASI